MRARLWGVAFVAASMVGAPAFAQDEIESAPAEVSEPGQDPTTDLPEIGEDQLAVFVLQRGFYFSSDLGVFMTFGGVRGYSNVQPYLSVKGGFDINDFLGVQLAISSGYASGNPISDNDVFGAGGQETESYGLFNAGGEVVFALRPTERFAIEPKVGGGLTRIYPSLTSPSDVNATLSSTNPHVVGGVDFKYLTLLTDFTAGLSVTAYYVIGPNIFATAEAVVVRYTF